MTTNYEPVIGMEIHVELKTKSKMFCGCKNDPFHAPKPNIYTCPVCLGLPGALPVPNRIAVEWTILLGLALGCDIPLESKFDRKNYFYPDLPKGYQISQYDSPLALGGSLENIRIRRVHLEEDTGKLLHATVDGKKVTLIDFNRSGVPLVEIVTEPDIRSGEQARVFLKKLHQIIRYLNISDADMEKGSMRLEPNISIRKIGETQLPPYKVEVKNINSFAFVKKAIEYETARHIEYLEKGETPPQETRGWNEDKGISFSQRRKEGADDYRYFPEPDIPPMKWKSSEISAISLQLPELPDVKKERFMKKYGLSEYDAGQLTETRERADFFEEIANLGTPKIVANIIINKKAKTREEVAGFLQSPTGIPERELQSVIEHVLKDNPKAVEDYKNGKQQTLGFLLGQVLRQLKGNGDAQAISAIIKRLII